MDESSDPSMFCIPVRFRDTNWLKVKEWKKICHATVTKKELE